MENTDRLTLTDAGIARPKSPSLQTMQHSCNSVDLAGIHVSKQAVIYQDSCFLIIKLSPTRLNQYSKSKCKAPCSSLYR